MKSLPQDQWDLFGRDWKRLYAIGVISKAGSGKDETLVGPTVFHELVRGVADLVLVQLARGTGSNRVQKFVMNEAGSFMSLPRLPHYVDIGRGEGVYLMYVLQSYSQLVRRLGAAGAKNLWTGSAAQIVGQGAEPELAEEMSRYTNPVRITHCQPRQHGQDPGGEHLSEERRQGLLEHHITGLKTGEWVMRVAPEIHRFRVPERYTQTKQLKKLKRKLARRAG